MHLTNQALNRLIVLKAIRHAGPVARTQLPQLTGLAGGTITYLTSDLVERGLVIETRDSAMKRGRPRAYLSIAAAGGMVVGISIGGSGQLSAAFVDLAGNLLHSGEALLKPAATLDAYAEAIANAVAEAIATSPFARSEVSRVGISLPGVVDTHRGIVHYVTTFPSCPTPFAEPISRALGIPVTIENDMACMARAEHWFGRAQHLQTFTLVDFGLSLGSARYIDGLPMTGANGISPEIGHMKIERGPEARQCYCGGRGCTTTYASIYGILLAGGELEGLAFPPVESLSRLFSRLLDRAEAGDARARASLDLAGDRLGVAIANHLNAADPGEILILMPDARLQPMIRERFEDALVSCVMPGMLANTSIAFALSDESWRWKGSAALALEQTYLSSPL